MYQDHFLPIRYPFEYVPLSITSDPRFQEVSMRLAGPHSADLKQQGLVSKYPGAVPVRHVPMALLGGQLTELICSLRSMAKESCVKS
jgi:hypothetical protein